MVSNILKVIGWFALILVIAPSLMFLGGCEDTTLDDVKKYMLIATVLWFAAEGIRWKLGAPKPSGD